MYLPLSQDVSLVLEVRWSVPASTRITQRFKLGVHNGVVIGASTPGKEEDGIVAFFKRK